MLTRWVILIAILNSGECARHKHRRAQKCADESSEESYGDIFEQIADGVIGIDNRLRRACPYEDSTALESFGSRYTRKVMLAGYDEDRVSVRIRHRVMFTSVEHVIAGRPPLEDIKILPRNLNTRRAFYEIKKFALYINIPYMNDYNGYCHNEINEELIEVPNGSDNGVSDYDPDISENIYGNAAAKGNIEELYKILTSSKPSPHVTLTGSSDPDSETNNLQAQGIDIRADLKYDTGREFF